MRNPNRFLEKQQAKYSGQLATLLGIPAPKMTVLVGPTPGMAAGTVGTTMTFDPNYLASASRRDITGALIHEMTHAFQQVPGGTVKSKFIEALADQARMRLGFGNGGGAGSSAEARLSRLNPEQFRAVAGSMAAGTFTGSDMPQPNGPRQGPTRPGGRARNTAMNARSKATPPPLPPGQADAFTQQLVALQSKYGAAVAGTKAALGTARGAFRSALGDIRANQIAGAAGAEGDALARGIVGSSSDLGARGAVIAEAAGAKVDALATRDAAMTDARLGLMTAQSDYQLGAAGVASAQAAAQSELANQRFENDMYDAQQTRFRQLYERILAQLLDRGKSPSGTTPLLGNAVNPDVSTPGYDPRQR